MSKQIFLILFGVILALLFCACPEINTMGKKSFNFNKSTGFFIVNEGIFQQANASVYYYDWEQDSVYENIFENTQNEKLGDVLQSMYILDDKAYFVLNNSSWIYVAKANTMDKIAKITGFVSPRYLLPVNSEKAYVSDLYSGYIYVLDLNDNIISDSIFTGRWTEEMALFEDKLYVTCPWLYSSEVSKKVLVLDTKSDVIIDSLITGINPKSIDFDANGYLWIFNTGNSLKNVKGSIYKINPIDKNVLDSFKFENELNIFTGSFRFNDTRDSLFVLYNDIYKFSANEKIQPEKIIERKQENFYGIDIDNENSKIYLTDAIDFGRKGKVYIYSKNGKLIKTIRAGYLPNSVVVY